MFKLKEETVLVPLTELRTRAREILKEAETCRVVLEMHHKPVAILMPIKTYELYEKIMDVAEDEYFAEIIKKRSSKKTKWITHETMKKTIHLK